MHLPETTMLVYTHHLTNRCRYIFNLIFTGLLNMDYTLTDQLARYNTYEGAKLAYTSSQPGDGFFIESTTLLFEDNIHAVQPDIFSFAGTVAFFKTNAGQLSFDIFAASFYLVSRYEEYLPFEPDQYGRFPAKNSLSYKHGFLQNPVVNCWVQEFKKTLILYYPSLRCADTRFQPVISFDIDVAYAYTGRPFWWNAAALLKNLALAQGEKLVSRLQVLTSRKKDPYDTYGSIQKMLQPYQSTALFFFLLTETRSRFDRNLPPSSQQLQQLIRQQVLSGSIGIHPSYYSMEKPALLQQEKNRLEGISGQPVTRSRQHYLRFSLPGTYIHLAAAGITDDYSMGYADMPGFRAGICTPFYFFDLESNTATTVQVHPITYMDGTFIEDLHMQPEESIATIRQLVSAVKQVQGNFLCIWHNHTVSETGVYKGWKQVLQETLHMMYEPPIF